MKDQLILDVLSQAVEKGVNQGSRVSAAQAGSCAEVNGVVGHCPVSLPQTNQSPCSS